MIVAVRDKLMVGRWKGLAPAERLLTAGDVARVTGLSTETLAQWRSQRRGIPFIKLSRNVVRYRHGDLDEWLAERLVGLSDEATIPGTRS
jgi:predicted DNA-binding transcriptional regulator AlpA